MPPRRRVKVEKRLCPYCERMIAVKYFKGDICKFCERFDRAAKLDTEKVNSR